MRKENVGTSENYVIFLGGWGSRGVAGRRQWVDGGGVEKEKQEIKPVLFVLTST